MVDGGRVTASTGPEGAGGFSAPTGAPTRCPLSVATKSISLFTYSRSIQSGYAAKRSGSAAATWET